MRRFAAALVIAQALAGATYAETRQGHIGEWGLDEGSRHPGPLEPRCILTWTYPGDPQVSLAAFGSTLDVMFRQPKVSFPYGITYTLVWSGAAGTLRLNAREIAHAFLIVPMSFDNDPNGLLREIYRDTSLVTVFSSAMPKIAVALLPIPENMLAKRNACISRT